MTHTLDSIMALADRMYSAPAGTLKDMIEGELRLAISEVLAERDGWKRGSELGHESAMEQRVRAVQAEAECERLRKDAERLKGLRKLAGFVEDGSNEAVRLYQDDATKDWFVSVGKRNWFGSSLSAAIDAAIAQERT